MEKKTILIVNDHAETGLMFSARVGRRTIF